MTTPTPKITVGGDPDWPLDGECSRCGEHHFKDASMAWVLPSEGGAERDLVVRLIKSGGTAGSRRTSGRSGPGCSRLPSWLGLPVDAEDR